MSRYSGGHNPSLDEGFTVQEPVTYADDFVCTCVVCGQVFRSRPKKRSDGSPGWESIESLWDHASTHKKIGS